MLEPPLFERHCAVESLFEVQMPYQLELDHHATVKLAFRRKKPNFFYGTYEASMAR